MSFARIAEFGGLPRDTEFFDDPRPGVTRVRHRLSRVCPYLDRAPGQLSPIEKGVLAIGA
jgi:hypothetical protein